MNLFFYAVIMCIYQMALIFWQIPKNMMSMKWNEISAINILYVPDLIIS